jgi:predicted GIY-YIG superfamily endonuclease
MIIISGIYYIKNITNNKLYIGSSKDILKRFYEHKRLLRHNKHHSIRLQRAWDKYG